MVDIPRMEELGRMIMAASVEAEYQRLANVVGYLDAAFADIVSTIVDQRVEDARVERREREAVEEVDLPDLGLIP